MQEAYLVHHGIKGQKWGVRRYQNPDGTLTEAGRARQVDFRSGSIAKRLNKYERLKYDYSISSEDLKKKAEKLRKKSAKSDKYVQKAEKAAALGKAEYERMKEVQSTQYRLLNEAKKSGYVVDSKDKKMSPRIKMSEGNKFVGAFMSTSALAGLAVLSAVGVGVAPAGFAIFGGLSAATTTSAVVAEAKRRKKSKTMKQYKVI